MSNDLSCAGLASDISLDEIYSIMEYYKLEGKRMKPQKQMRMRHFNIEGYLVPRMVLNNKFIEL